MNIMSRKKLKKRRKRKTIGVEAVVEPGVGALYVRGTWMRKLSELGKRKRKKSRSGPVKNK